VFDHGKGQFVTVIMKGLRGPIKLLEQGLSSTENARTLSKKADQSTEKETLG